MPNFDIEMLRPRCHLSRLRRKLVFFLLSPQALMALGTYPLQTRSSHSSTPSLNSNYFSSFSSNQIVDPKFKLRCSLLLIDRNTWNTYYAALSVFSLNCPHDLGGHFYQLLRLFLSILGHAQLTSIRRPNFGTSHFYSMTLSFPDLFLEFPARATRVKTPDNNLFQNSNGGPYLRNSVCRRRYAIRGKWGVA